MKNTITQLWRMVRERREQRRAMAARPEWAAIDDRLKPRPELMASIHRPRPELMGMSEEQFIQLVRTAERSFAVTWGLNENMSQPCLCNLWGKFMGGPGINILIFQRAHFGPLRYERKWPAFVPLHAPHDVIAEGLDINNFSSGRGALEGFGEHDHASMYATSLASEIFEGSPFKVMSSEELARIGREVVRASPFYVDPAAIPEATQPAAARKRL